MPRVAVILAAYNAAPYVGEAIRSVLEQTVGDLELVVVDDGSTDGTAAVVETFLDDPRVTLLRQENLGQAAAKNRGIRESTAPIIGFCDADDYWDPRKLELQLPAFERPEVGVVYSREERFADTEQGRIAIPYQAEECHSGRVTEALFVENFVPFGTALVRRSCLDKSGPFNEHYRMGIDWDLWLRLSLECEFQFIDEVTYHYRIWEGQMSNDWRGRYEHAIWIMEAFLAAHPGAVSSRTVRRAWAHTYANRAKARVEKDFEWTQGLLDLSRAIARDPAFWGAWRNAGLIFRMAVRRPHRRSGFQAREAGTNDAQ